MSSHKFVLRDPWKPPSQSSGVMDSLLPQPPLPPQPTQVKSLQEMAETVQLTDDKPKPRGLFWDLLGGDYHSLASDIVEHPDHYDDRLVVLARELVEGRRKLDDVTREEQSLLNRGVIDFAQFRPQPQKPKAPPPPPAKVRPSDETKVTEPPPFAEPGVDVPETPGGMRPYWWV